MNSIVLSGVVTKDAEVRWTSGDKPMCIARFTLAIPRKLSRNNESDFPQCKAFGKTAENAEKYFKKGVKLTVRGNLQTGSYTNRDGAKVYTTEVVVEEWEFAERKAASQQYQQSQDGAPAQQYAQSPMPQTQAAPPQQTQYQQGNMFNNQMPQNYNNAPSQYPGAYPNTPQPQNDPGLDGFMNIPDGIGADELPFA